MIQGLQGEAIVVLDVCKKVVKITSLFKAEVRGCFSSFSLQLVWSTLYHATTIAIWHNPQFYTILR